MNTVSYLKNQKMMLAMLAFVLLASMAIALPAQAKSTMPPIPAPCTQNCLRVTDIYLTKSGSTSIEPIEPLKPPYITAVVTVKQTPSFGNIGGAAGVRVYANWTLLSL
jgi:hypothetical protein